MRKIKKFLFIGIVSLTTISLLATFKKTASEAHAATIPEGQTLDANADVISVRDLTFNGKNNQLIIQENKNTDATFSFSESNVHKSIIFKFKYDVVDTNTSDSNAVNIYMGVQSSNKWDTTRSLWLRGDGTYIARYQGDSFSYKKLDALAEGMHDIEYGRVALLDSGTATGNYYSYYKLDGVEVRSDINPYDVSTIDSRFFFNYSDGNTSNKIYDASYEKTSFEVADVITVNDLMVDGIYVKNAVSLGAHNKLYYNSTAEHKSVVYKLRYEVLDPSNVDCQLHFADGWSESQGFKGGMIWLRNDKTYLRKSDTGYYEANRAFDAAGVYNLEFGKLYYATGENATKYHVYLKVNGSTVIEADFDSMPDKAALFTTGTNGDILYDLNYIPAELKTDLYLYKWDVSKSGILFIAELNKAVVDLANVSEAGFIIQSNNESNRVQGKLVQEGTKYAIKAAVASLEQVSITKKYSAKLYYVIPNELGANKTYYGEEINTSFYKELDDLSGISSESAAMLNEIKSSVLNVRIDEDDCEVTGATKTGDFSSSTITLTGSKSSYASFVLNDEYLSNNSYVQIGYLTYKVTLGANTITLTKQTKKMIYGGSEHFVELNSGHDEKMTAVNLSPMASELGLKSVRLDISFSDLFSISSNNELTVNRSHVAKVQAVIDELKTNGGVTDFLGVFWVIQPYGYKTWEGKPWSDKTCPNPSTEANLYLKWLQINGEAARIAAGLFPDIHNFETWNEAEIMSESDGPLAKSDGSNYSVTEKAKILTDLMYYYNRAIKSVNPKNKLTTPSLCCAQRTDSEFDVTSVNFLSALYAQIKDSTPVTGFSEVDTDANNYFEVINIHPYLGRGTTVSNWKSFVQSFHNLAANNDDSGTEIWVTEFGFAQNRESNCQSNMLSVLAYANQIEYLTKFYFYKIHDYTSKIDDDRWGLYDYDGNIKQIGTAVKNYIKENE